MGRRVTQSQQHGSNLRPLPDPIEGDWQGQFSVRKIFLVVLVVCIPTFLLLRPYLAQSAAARQLEELGGVATTRAAAPDWFRRQFGEGPLQKVIAINVSRCDNPSEYMPHVLNCPHLEHLVVEGKAFNDEHLAQLSQMAHLRGLVLISTSASKSAIQKLVGELPQLHVRQHVPVEDEPGGSTVESATDAP